MTLISLSVSDLDDSPVPDRAVAEVLTCVGGCRAESHPSCAQLTVNTRRTNTDRRQSVLPPLVVALTTPVAAGVIGGVFSYSMWPNKRDDCTLKLIHVVPYASN